MCGELLIGTGLTVLDMIEVSEELGEIEEVLGEVESSEEPVSMFELTGLEMDADSTGLVLGITSLGTRKLFVEESRLIEFSMSLIVLDILDRVSVPVKVCEVERRIEVRLERIMLDESLKAVKALGITVPSKGSLGMEVLIEDKIVVIVFPEASDEIVTVVPVSDVVVAVVRIVAMFVLCSFDEDWIEEVLRGKSFPGSLWVGVTVSKMVLFLGPVDGCVLITEGDMPRDCDTRAVS